MKRYSFFTALLLGIMGLFLVGCPELFVEDEPDPTYTVDVRLEVQVLDKQTKSIPQEGVPVYLHIQKYDGKTRTYPDHGKFKWLLTTNQDGFVVSGWCGYNLRHNYDHVDFSGSLDGYSLIVNNNYERFQDAQVYYSQVKNLAGSGTHAKVTRTLFLYLE